MLASICSEPKVLEVMRIIDIFVDIIRIVVPLLLIFSLMFKFMSAIKTGEEDNLAKVKKSAVTNVVAALVIFLIPNIVNIVVNVTFPNSDYKNCLNVTMAEVNVSYENKMERLIKRAEETLNMNDYNAAKGYLKNIKDETKRKEYEKRLDAIYQKILETMKLKIVSVDVEDSVVKIEATSGVKKVAGYYFSSIEKTPNLDGFDWIETDETTFSIVKFPGTYYLYAKDESGYITEAKKVVVPQVFDVTFKRQGKKDLPRSLGTYLESIGSSVDAFNKKIASYNKKYGLRTRTSVVVGAMAFIGEIQGWGYYLPYGGSNDAIKKESWGVRSTWRSGERGFLACNPYVIWSFKNAGLNIYGDWDKIRHDITRNVRITSQGLTEYELLVKPETYNGEVHIYRYFVGVLASKNTYGDNIIPVEKGQSGDVLQNGYSSGHEMLIVDKYDDDMDGISDGYIVLQSRDIGLCYEKRPYTAHIVTYDMTNVYNNTAGFASYLRGWNTYYIPTSDYPSYLR